MRIVEDMLHNINVNNHYHNNFYCHMLDYVGENVFVTFVF